MMSVPDVRRFAMSLPGTTESPHFDMASFRVAGRIFATVPADGRHLHVFLDEPDVSAAVSTAAAFRPLLWGNRLRGVRVDLAAAPPDVVRELLDGAWRRKAPTRLRAASREQ